MLILLPMSVLFLVSLKIEEANVAYTFFAQSMAICRPYMADKQAETFSSRFASVRGRADYMNIIAELRRIAASKQLTLPDYKPW